MKYYELFSKVKTFSVLQANHRFIYMFQHLKERDFPEFSFAMQKRLVACSWNLIESPLSVVADVNCL